MRMKKDKSRRRRRRRKQRKGGGEGGRVTEETQRRQEGAMGVYREEAHSRSLPGLSGTLTMREGSLMASSGWDVEALWIL